MKPKAAISNRSGLPQIFSYAAARAAGISAERLYSYRDQGSIEQIGRVLYRWAGTAESDQNLLEIAYRTPRGTLCLTTALARHELTDVIQARIDIAIPRGSRAPALRSPVDIHVFAAETFDLGREKIDAGHGLARGLYSANAALSI